MMNNYKISKQIQVAYALLYNIEYYIHYMKYKMQEKLLLNKIYVEYKTVYPKTKLNCITTSFCNVLMILKTRHGVNYFKKFNLGLQISLN